MAVSRSKSITQPLILAFGFVILIGALFTYYFILNGVFGRFDSSELIPDPHKVGEYVLGQKPRAAILRSDYTVNLLPEQSTWMRDNINTWQRFFDLMSVKYEVVDDDFIETGKLNEFNLLILPGSKSLSDREIIEIKKFLDRGGSVFATSGTASFSDDGKWRGWEFLSEVFGLKFVTDLGDENTEIHTLRGGLPLTANIPTGYPLRIATWDKPMAVEVLDPRTVQASFWYNYRVKDGLVRDEIKRSAGITYGTYGNGRFIWMGFEINSVVGIQDDYVFFEKLFRNSINWLTKKPVAYVKEWPGNYRAAAAIVPVIGPEAENVNNLLDILYKNKMKAVFLVDEETTDKNSKLLKNLTSYGNIAVVADVGYLTSINDSINTLNDYDQQVHELENLKSKIKAITGIEPEGAKSYHGLFDGNTLKALVQTGYKYILTDSLSDRSVPENIILRDGNIVTITKTTRDDYEVIRDFNLTDPNFQFYTYQEDIDRVLFEGSLYVFMPHTEYQCKDENVKVISDVIDELKKKEFWITTLESISEWYSKKGYVELGVELRSNSRIAIRITNNGEESIDNLIVNIEMSGSAEDISISSEIIGKKPAAFDYDDETKILHLFIKNLKDGESRTYYVDYSVPNV